MADFTLVRRKPKTWSIDIDGVTYYIPLANSITPEVAETLNTPEGTRDFFRSYIGPEVYDTLVTEERNEITNAWVTASKAAGTTPGES